MIEGFITGLFIGLIIGAVGTALVFLYENRRRTK